MLKTVNRYLLRLGGSFFVGKWLVQQILAENRVSLIGCSAVLVLCQALQQYTVHGCIFNRILHLLHNSILYVLFGSYTVLMNHSVMYQTSKGYTCTVCNVSHIHACILHAAFEVWLHWDDKLLVLLDGIICFLVINSP